MKDNGVKLFRYESIHEGLTLSAIVEIACVLALSLSAFTCTLQPKTIWCHDIVAYLVDESSSSALTFVYFVYLTFATWIQPS